MGEVAAAGADTGWCRVDDRAGDARPRRAAMAFADRLGFDEGRAGEVGIVATELTTNLARHAGGGTIAIRRLFAGGEAGIGLLAMDRGPGIPDVAGALLDGHSTASTLGIGLGAVQRLSTSTEVHSVPGRGTVISVAMWRHRHRRPEPDVVGLTRPLADEQVCGDAIFSAVAPSHRLLVLADGLGHGPLAAMASGAAIEVAAEAPDRSPAELLGAMHERLTHTRGAAVAVVRADLSRGALAFAGVGNVAAWVVDGDRRQGILSQPGIVGGRRPRTIREEEHRLPPGGAVVLHSDGVTDRWEVKDCAGAWTRPPVLVAGLLMRDAAVRHDDASVLVARVAS